MRFGLRVEMSLWSRRMSLVDHYLKSDNIGPIVALIEDTSAVSTMVLMRSSK